MRKQRESFRQLFVQSMVYFLLAVGSGWLLHGQLSTVKKEVELKATLSTLREGLQAYYAEKEGYVKMSPAPAAAVIEILRALEFLPQVPLNPYTGKPYTAEDVDTDKIQYEAGEDFQSFRLSAEKPGSKEVWFAIECP